MNKKLAIIGLNLHKTENKILQFQILCRHEGGLPEIHKIFSVKDIQPSNIS